jgi:hypothetical protein
MRQMTGFGHQRYRANRKGWTVVPDVVNSNRKSQSLGAAAKSHWRAASSASLAKYRLFWDSTLASATWPVESTVARTWIFTIP